MIFQILSRKFSTAKSAITLVKDLFLKKPLGSEKTIQGWATSVRKMGKIIFVDVTDGSCLSPLQVVIPKKDFKGNIQNGSSLSITGNLQETPKGQLELIVKCINTVGDCDITDNFPFNLKEKQSYDHYRQFLHFRPKIKFFSSMMRFRSAAAHKIHQYFIENNFILIHTPVLTSSDCEGAAETFMVRPQSWNLIKAMERQHSTNDTAFFNSPAYLTVSGQLHLEAVARSIAKVYTFNTSFRAENSVSRLHLSEFYMVEAEEAFITELESLLSRIEDLIKHILSHLLSNHLNEIEYMLQHNESDMTKHLNTLQTTINKPFSVMTFSEAKGLINKNMDKIQNFQPTPFNLTKAEEHFLVQHNGNVPVFVVDWPKNNKPFYMKEMEGNPNLVKGVDLLLPNVGEVCGGSLREDNYDVLKDKLTELKLLDCLQWYLDLRKYGNVPTAGFGLGFERFLQFVLNIQSIKDAIPFPRWPHHLQL